MQKYLLTFVMSLTISLGFAQANLETDSAFPTGYIKATSPYYYGTQDGVLYVFSGRDPFILVRYPEADTRQSFTIPNTVSRISRGAFKGCKNLEELIIPTSVFYIGDNAFDDSAITSFVVSGNDFGAVNAPVRESSGQNQYYDLSGKAISQPEEGISIVVSDGVAKKVMVK